MVGHGRKEDLSPPLQVSGEGLQPISSVLCGCLGLPFSMKWIKPSSPATRKQREEQKPQQVPAFSLAYVQLGTFPLALPR